VGSRLTKRDAVAATLRNEISRGTLSPGAHLLQHEVAARLGVSPTPVREAFSVLALEGFVAWDAYRGVTVAPDFRADVTLADLYELRGALEVLAVRRGGLSIDPTMIRELEEAEAEGIAADRAKDVNRWWLANSRFHDALVAMARSDLLNQLMGIVLRRSLFFPIVDRSRVHREHRALIQALKAGDLDKAVRLTKEHASANIEAARKEKPVKRRGAPRARP
jgi:DNA-binding GntR family transcriptional regulator